MELFGTCEINFIRKGMYEYLVYTKNKTTMFNPFLIGNKIPLKSEITFYNKQMFKNNLNCKHEVQMLIL